jgi:hypothetical protein
MLTDGERRVRRGKTQITSDGEEASKTVRRPKGAEGKRGHGEMTKNRKKMDDDGQTT